MSVRKFRAVARHSSRKQRTNTSALQRAVQSTIDTSRWENLETRVMMAVTPPVVVYNFEDAPTGTTVVNSGTGGAAYNGTIAGDDGVLPTFSTDTGPGGGHYMTFSGSGTYEGTGGRVDSATLLNPIMGATSTLAYWVRTTQAGVANAWQSPGVTGAEQAGAGDDIFWGNQTGTGGARVQAGDGNAATTTPITDPNPDTGDAVWHQVVLTRNATTGAENAYLDGTLVSSATGDIGIKGAHFRAIGATTDVAGNDVDVQGYNYLAGDLDKIEIYNYAMSASDVIATYGAPATAVPAAPTALTATATGASTIDLSFTDNATNEGAFEILQSRTPSATGANVIASLAPSADTGGTLTYTARGLFPGTQYYYFVRAINKAGSSTPLATANATTNAARTADVPAGPGAYAEFFNVSSTDPNIDADPALTRVDPNVDFDFGNGSPGAGVNSDNFSSRWTGKLGVPADFNGNGITGETFPVRFVTNSDDGAFLWVNGETVAFDQTYHGQFDRLADKTVNLTEGQAYPFQFEQFEGGGGAGAHLKVVLPTGGIAALPAATFVSAQRGPVPAPSNLRGTNLDFNQATVVFDNDNSTAQNYFITLTDPSGGTREFKTTPDGSPFNISGLSANTTYTVKVKGYNVEGGLSPESTATFTTLATGLVPAAPSVIRVLPRAGATAVTVTDNSFNETGFVFERSVNGGAFSEVGRVNPTAPGTTGGIISFTDTGTTAGQSVVYRIRAAGTPAPAGGGDSATVLTTAVTIPTPGTGVRKTSFDDIDFTGNDTVPDPVVQNPVPQINENFGNGGPVAGIGPDQFSVIYDGYFQAEVTGSYRFGLSSDDGVSMLLIDPTTATPLIDFNNLGARRGADFNNPQDIVGPVNLVAGTKYPIEVRMVEDGGGAGVEAFQSIEGGPFETLPTAVLFPPDTNAPPAFAPKNVTASALCTDRVTVNFTDLNFTETGFQIEKAASAAGPWTSAGADLPANANTFSLNGPFAAGTPIFFRIRPTGPGGTFGPYSDPVSATPYDGTTESGTDLTLNGSAKFITVPPTTDDDTQALQLTPAVNYQSGSAYLSHARDLDRDWSTHFTFTEPAGNGADGFTFIVQSNNPNVIGGGGGGLASSGVPNSLAIKFDIYNNIHQTGIYVNGQMADDGTDIGFPINNDHVFDVTITFAKDKADVDGDGTPDAGTANDAITVKIVDLTDDTQTPFEQTYSTDHAGNPFDLKTILGGDCGYIGFSGGTGGLNQEQDILDWKFNTQDIPLVKPVGGATIDRVYVRGSTWAGPDTNAANTTFGEFLAAKGLGDATYGFRVDNLPADTTIPWINVNQVVLHYSSPLTAGGLPTPGSIVLDGQLSDYTVTGVTQLDGQTVALSLDRALGIQPAPATDPTQGDRVKLTVPTAGPGGTNYTLTLNPLQGDADRAPTHRVNAIDLGFVKARANTSTNDTATTGAVYTAFADLNGSGRIDAIDLGAAKARNNDSLPAAAATASALFGEKRIADEVLA